MPLFFRAEACWTDDEAGQERRGSKRMAAEEVRRWQTVDFDFWGRGVIFCMDVLHRAKGEEREEKPGSRVSWDACMESE